MSSLSSLAPSGQSSGASSAASSHAPSPARTSNSAPNSTNSGAISKRSESPPAPISVAPVKRKRVFTNQPAANPAPVGLAGDESASAPSGGATLDAQAQAQAQAQTEVDVKPVVDSGAGSGSDAVDPLAVIRDFVGLDGKSQRSLIRSTATFIKKGLDIDWDKIYAPYGRPPYELMAIYDLLIESEQWAKDYLAERTAPPPATTQAVVDVKPVINPQPFVAPKGFSWAPIDLTLDSDDDDEAGPAATASHPFKRSNATNSIQIKKRKGSDDSEDETYVPKIGHKTRVRRRNVSSAVTWGSAEVEKLHKLYTANYKQFNTANWAGIVAQFPGRTKAACTSALHKHFNDETRKMRLEQMNKREKEMAALASTINNAN